MADGVRCIAEASPFGWDFRAFFEKMVKGLDFFNEDYDFNQ